MGVNGLRVHSSLSILAVGLLGCSAPVLAQTGPADAVDTASEIVVTAQKRAERLQDVPISITAISGDTLQQSGVESLKDISALAPGLQFQTQNGFTQPMIRGVGTSVVQPGSGSNVGLYLDGFYLPNPLTTDFQLLSVSSVQVLKGPQGTLFGRNSTGGAILVTTSEPTPDPALRAELSYASRNTQKYQAYATAGLGTSLAFDVAGLYSKGNGFKHDNLTNAKTGRYENWAIRLGAKLNLTDNFYLLARYSHARNDDPTAAQGNVYCCNAAGAPMTSGAPYGATGIATRPDEVSANLPQTFSSKSDAYQLTAAADFDFGKLTSYTQFRKETATHLLDLDETRIPIFDIQFTYADKVFTQELILASQPGRRLQWTAGFFYFRDENPAHTEAGFGGPLAGFVNNSVTVQSVAGYVDATYELTERLFLTGGLRYAHDVYKDAFYHPGGIGSPAPQTYLTPINNDSWTPRAVIRFKPDDNSSLYASFSKGYKSAQRDLAGSSDRLVRPEDMTAFEVGYKLATRSLSLNLAAYYYDYKDLQVSNYDGGQAHLNNADKAHIIGFDGDVRFRFSKAFEAYAGVSIVDATYRDWPTAPRYDQCLSPTACGAGYGLFIISPTDAAGLRLQFAPKFTGNFGANYTTQIASGKFTLSGNFAYTSKMYFDSANQFDRRGFENLDVRAQWTDPSGHYTIAAFGENVTGDRHYTNITPQPLAIVALWNSPSVYGVSLGLNF